MRLSDLLNAITSAKIQVTLLESNETELIKFYTGGQEVLNAELLAREVSTLKIDNQTSITVELKPLQASM